MAFSSTIKGSKDLGGCKMIHGTWATDGGTATGTITWGGTRGDATGIPHTIIDGTAISSVSATTMTAAKITATGTMVITCVANDSGYWSVTYA